MKKQPIIGITLDHEAGGGYSPVPWYAVRENYADILSRLGALPIMLPHDVEQITHYAGMIDGVLLTGGDFDIPPSMYGDNTQHDTVTTKDRRSQFEYDITKQCIEKNKAVLGICGGEQMLNVVLGGSLIQHIPDEIDNALPHEVEDRVNPAHTVTIIEDTLLHSIVGTTELGVNTSHHQAIKQPAPEVIINATAPDSVIEGIEYPDHPFCLGVQWHPEYEVSESDTAIFTAFINAAAK